VEKLCFIYVSLFGDISSTDLDIITLFSKFILTSSTFSIKQHIYNQSKTTADQRTLLVYLLYLISLLHFMAKKQSRNTMLCRPRYKRKWTLMNN